MKRTLLKKYKAVSLVELLITMVILAVVMMLASVTLTTMIKASIISNSRTTTRQESEFVLEYIKRTIRNSQAEDLKLYAVQGRSYNPATGLTVDTAVTGYGTLLGEGSVGTEIHFRPVGYDRWVCVGFFPDFSDPNRGYILKSTAKDLASAQTCFDSLTTDFKLNTLLLNSEDVDVNVLGISYYNTVDMNFLMTVDLDMEPIHWLPNKAALTPNYFQQAVVSTQKLTWEY